MGATLFLGLFLIWIGIYAITHMFLKEGSIVLKVVEFPTKLFPHITIPLFVPVVIRRSFIIFFLFLGLAGGWKTVGIIGLAYLVVVIHEFAHSIVAIYFGYKVPKIEIYPMAGMAHLEGKFYNKPYHEFYIGVAGPGSNVIMGLLAWPIAMMYPNFWTTWFLEVNVIIGLFNMLPIFPLDGGRILRSSITSLTGDVNKATAYACNASLIATFIICPFLWLYWNPVAALLIGLMALLGRAEKHAIKMDGKKEEIDTELAELKTMSDQYGAKLLAVYEEAKGYTVEDWKKLDWDELHKRIEAASQADKELHEEVEARLEAVKSKIERELK